MKAKTSQVSVSLQRVIGLACALSLLIACNGQPAGTDANRSRSTPIVTVVAVASREATSMPASTNTSESEDSSAGDATAVAQPLTDLAVFKDDPSGLSFQFPKAWQGPSVLHSNNTVQVQVGSDTVYPYGTGLDERKYEVKDAYFVEINYTKATSDTLEQRKKFIDEWLGRLSTMRDGESVSGVRELLVRVRETQHGPFKGLEFISTLSDTAQTEFSYSRVIALYDEQFNTLVITSYPNNVTLNSDPATMASLRADYAAVDETHRPVLYQILESIALS